MSYNLIPVTKAKDFLQYIIKNINDDKELENFILKEYRTSFAEQISAINDKKTKDGDTLHFMIKDNKLYFIGSLMGVAFDIYRDMVNKGSTFEEKQALCEPLFHMLLSNLKCIRFKVGYNYLAYILKDILISSNKEDNKEDEVEPIALMLGNKYGERIEYLILKINDYRLLLEGVNGFSFKEWDTQRSEIDAEVILSQVVRVQQNIGSLTEYVKIVILLMERGCAELKRRVDKINFN